MNLTITLATRLWRKLCFVWLDNRARKAALLAPVSVGKRATVGYDYFCSCGADARAVCVRGTRCAVNAAGQGKQGAAAVSEPTGRSCVLEFNVVSRIANGHGANTDLRDVFTAPARTPLALLQTFPSDVDESVARTERGRGDDRHPLERVPAAKGCPWAECSTTDVLRIHD
jgi:hypothetical protein